MKPIINIDDVDNFTDIAKGRFTFRLAPLSPLVGAKRLSYNLTVVPPGKTAFPFHNHHNNEEMFLILEGTGLLLFGDQEYPLKPRDLVACPPGGREVAHQMINTGDRALRNLALSTNDPFEICEYPDSNKVLAMVGDYSSPRLRLVTRADSQVDHYDGESP